MVTDTQKHMSQNDNKLVWTIGAIIALALLAYAAYAIYDNNRYDMRTTTTSGTSTTNSQ